MFIQTEATPNPATLKFLPGRPVLESGTFEARDAAEAERSPLAKALMELPGVGGVFLAPDFISVTKTEGEWQHLRPAVLGVVTEFFLSGAPALTGGRRRRGRRVLPRRGRRDGRDDQGTDRDPRPPAVAGDGGDIVFKGFRDGIVYLAHEGRLLRLPVLDRDAEARHREPAQALPAGGGEGGRADLRAPR